MKNNYKNFIPLIIGIALFEQIVGHQLLAFENINWLLTNGDTATHYLGSNFFKNDDWHWPIGLNPNYGIEYSSSIFFSDSIPIFAIIWGVADGELIGTIQLVGITVVLLGVYLVNVRNYHIASQLKLLIKKYFVKK